MLTATDWPPQEYVAVPQPVNVRVSDVPFSAVVAAFVGLALVLENVVVIVPETGVQQLAEYVTFAKQVTPIISTILW
jgi:hypothetical protein